MQPSGKARIAKPGAGQTTASPPAAAAASSSSSSASSATAPAPLPPPPPRRTTYQIYRASNLGETLQQALADIRDKYQLTDEVHEGIMSQFDAIVTEELEKQQTQVAIQAESDGVYPMYRCVDNVWTFILKDADVRVSEPRQRSGEQRLRVPYLKLVACDAR
eukprot:TRINITY_DN94225_c0_g1_i1.p1 TRINITY_DN94225_c0_g1~~TRINITY_DN94225_c0_g1_i1.p1  ORF type:complete len:162 (-),score=36.20 TRINITY_DN94225_c0_g1_i1:40-525(-)